MAQLEAEYQKTHEAAERNVNSTVKMFEEISDYISKRSIMIHHDWDCTAPETAPLDLETMLQNRGETFSCMLLRLQEEKGLSGSELYHKAWVSKSVYSKIINNINYTPAKITAIAFGLALELSWPTFNELIQSAGYSMTNSNKFDTIIEYCVQNGVHSIDEVNALIDEQDSDLPLIGY